MKRLILPILLLLSFSLSGQNYQTISSNRIALFENGGQVKSLKVDTVKTAPDSVFVFSTTIRDKGNWCFTPYGDSWLGKSVSIKSDGDNIFLNRDRDSITIKTAALKDESWLAYEIADSIKVMATVSDHNTMTFMGVVDSVKTIEFAVYDKNMVEQDYSLSSMQVKISKNYGLVKTLNYYQFPNYESEYPNEYLCEYNIIGITNPEIGVQNLTWFDVFDLQPGDELHVQYENWAYDERTDIKTIKKCIERTDYTDSICYTYKRKKSRHDIDPYLNIDDFEFYDDTISETIYPNALFDMFPGLNITSDGEFYYSYMNIGSIIEKFYEYHNLILNDPNSNCWDEAIVDGCFSPNIYLKGLGGPYYSCDGGNISPFTGYKKELVYYKKGETDWGTPLIITSTPKIKVTADDIKVIMNPGKEQVSVQIMNHSQPLTFEIFNIQGQLIIQTPLNSNTNTIDLHQIRSGIYIYRISDNQEVIKSGKIFNH